MLQCLSFNYGGLTVINGVITLSDTESFIYQIIMKYISGKIYRNEAALLLKKSERTITRLTKKIKNKGYLGAKHGNYARASNRKTDPDLKHKILKLKQTQYFDYNCKHFYEILVEKYNVEFSYKTLWLWLRKEHIVKNPRARHRKKHVYRPRLPQEGLLLQMDGSHHKFNGKDDWCLISCIDDATSEIPYAEFFNGETTLGCMKVLREVIKLKGVPRAIYTDRAGWSGGPKRTEFSQFQRACNKLGIQIIYANSPEAKGRIERSFRTIQDRLIPELRHKGITSMNVANTYLKDTFLKKYWNKEKTVAPTLLDTAYSPLDPYTDLNTVLCIEETRVISSDQTINLDGKRYLVELDSTSLARYSAVVRTLLDESVKVFVMENEVKLTPIEDLPLTFVADKRRERFTTLDEKVDKDIIHIMDRFIEDPVTGELRFNWKTISTLSNAVRQHQVTGKPLRIKKGLKRVA